MKNLFLVVIVTILIAHENVHADAATFAQKTSSFATQSTNAYNIPIYKEAIKASPSVNQPVNRGLVESLVYAKQNFGKVDWKNPAAGRPKALTIEDRIKQFTASLLEQKKKTGQPTTLSSQDVVSIQKMALLAQNQRG